MRAFWTLAHRTAGLATAFFLIVAGATGSVIAFHEELDHALNPDLFHVQERPAPVLGPGELAGLVLRAYPNAWVRDVALQREAGRSIRVGVAPRHDAATGKTAKLNINEVYVDPFDGRILGTRMRGAARIDRAHIIPFLYELHYTLHIPGLWGEWLLGIVALVWMFDCGVGFYLTLPVAARGSAGCETTARLNGKTWGQRWRQSWSFKRQASATRRNLDLHRAGGLWFWLVLFMLAFTGVYFNLRDEVFRPVVGLFGTITPPPLEQVRKVKDQRYDTALSIPQAIETARAALSDVARSWPAISIRNYPERGVYRVGFAEPGRREQALVFGFEQVFVDSNTGEVKARESYAEGTAADKFMDWQFPMHSGTVLGLPGRIIICLTGLIVVMLSVTGVIIWVRKRSARNARQFISRTTGCDLQKP